MTVVRQTSEMFNLSKRCKYNQEKLGLVPTMGALHEGHLSLVRKAKTEAQRVIVSIFVNPIQFGPNEDFARYPRDLEGDLRSLMDLGVDFVFAPTIEEMYPQGFETRVELSKLPNHLCGLKRIGHFSGVATVVLKLFNICQPDVAIFGMKDFQQVRVIERMVEDLNIPVKIIRHETIRDHDGLAMSSRNRYLSKEERVRATNIYKVLKEISSDIGYGFCDPKRLIDKGIGNLEKSGLSVEYFAICDPNTLEDVTQIEGEVLIATACWCGSTRLIDNMLASPKKTSQ